jgi:Domain of unknown function (DUF6249)
MRVHLIASCLLATLAVANRAQADDPTSTSPTTPSQEPTAAPSEVPKTASPPPVELEVQRQALEAHRRALVAQQREIESDINQLDVEARQIDATSRLSPEQLFQLLQQREARRSDSDVDPASVVIPIFFFTSTLVGFLGWLLASYRRTRMLHETVRQLVEKGAEIPTALLAPPPRKPSDLRRGIILITAGGGLAIFLAALPDVPGGVWVSGITLALIGVGHLIVWRVQTGKGRLSSELTPEPQN